MRYQVDNGLPGGEASDLPEFGEIVVVVGMVAATTQVAAQTGEQPDDEPVSIAAHFLEIGGCL